MTAKVVVNFEKELNRFIEEHNKLISLIENITKKPLEQFVSEDSPEYQLMRRRDANTR